MKRLSLFVALLAAFGFVAVGCSKNSSSEQSANATATSGAAAPGNALSATDVAAGKQIFTQNCSSCHGATGTEGGVGPSLKGEKSRKDMVQAIAWIKDPKPPMPKLYPSPLSDKDVSDVAAYVESL